MAGASKRKRAKSGKRTGARGRKPADNRLPHGCALSSERREQILVSLRKGDTRGIAAGKVGVAERTFQRWMRKGRDNLDEVDRADEDGEEGVELDLYGDFVLAVVAAESEVRSSVLSGIMGSEDWRAAAWYLERVANREFNRVQKIEEIATDENGDERSAGDLLLEKLTEIRTRESRFADGSGGG